MSNLRYHVTITKKFEKEFKKLKRRFPLIVNDYETLLNEIEIDGNLGDCIPNIKVGNGNTIFKKRMKNTSSRQGKSGGFRIIECLVSDSNEVFLLDIYSKSDQQNISNDKILELVRKANL